MKNQRIQILDAIRGIALCGILLMNIGWFAIPDMANEDLRIRNELSGPNFTAWWIIQVFFQGSMRGLFSMLFGASAVLVLQQNLKKLDPRSAIEQYYRRLIVLLLFGFFNAYILLWPGDILYTYAIAGMFLFPVMRLSPRKLGIAGGVLLVIISISLSIRDTAPLRMQAAAKEAIKNQSEGRPLPEEQKQAISAWDDFKKEHSVESKKAHDDAQAKLIKADYFTAFLCLSEISYMLETKYFFNYFFLDALSFFLIGMALFRKGILSGERSWKFYALISGIGYPMGIGLYWLQASVLVRSGFDPLRIAENLPINASEFGRLGITIGHIGLICLLYRMKIPKKFLRLWEPVGRMAFTNYLLQSLICGFIFNGYGLGLYDELERYELFYVVAGLWLFHLIFSHLWLRYFSQGPMEWLWRSATKGKWQPSIFSRSD